jgi:hypothetical protein
MRSTIGLIVTLALSGSAAAGAAQRGEIHGNWRVQYHGGRAASAEQIEPVQNARLRYFCATRGDGIAERLELIDPAVAKLEAGARYRLRIGFASGAEQRTVVMTAHPDRELLQSSGDIAELLVAIGNSPGIGYARDDAGIAEYPVSTQAFADAVAAARERCRHGQPVAPDGKGIRDPS